MLYDSHYFAYPSRRMTISARKGMVCASQPLAAQAGLDMLKKGGNAIDAALATAIALTVVEPVSNGIGGDAFAIVWMKDKMYGLNASGPAPGLMDADRLRAQGHTVMPKYGWIPVNVPGEPAGWRALSERFGKLPFEDLFEPAIMYAREGYPVSPVTARQWATAYDEYTRDLKDDCFKSWFDTFAPEGRAPRPAEIWRCESMARTLESLAKSKCEAFYKGNIAERIDYNAKKQEGLLRQEDLEKYEPEWVQPISVNYRGYDVWEIPPNGQGITALMALGILEGFEFDMHGSMDTCHRQIEAMKLAFADTQQYVADPRFMDVSPAQLLSKDYLSSRRSLIGKNSRTPKSGDPFSGGTVYLCAADGEGNMISYIQSNYHYFGSGIVIPGTGISLHNRGWNFSLTPGHANCAAPDKKPYHTIIPGFLTKNGRAVGPFGVMGAFMQPQGHVQVAMNSIDFHMNPQQALDAPRWQWVGGKEVEIENGFSGEIAYSLLGLGHNIKIASHSLAFGRGQIIWQGDDGVLTGGTEPRADGCVAAW